MRAGPRPVKTSKTHGVNVRVNLPQLLDVRHLLLLQQLHLPPVLGQTVVLRLEGVDLVGQPEAELLQVDGLAPETEIARRDSCRILLSLNLLPDVLQGVQLCQGRPLFHGRHPRRS